ncbi:RDD family protein [Corynebacterium freiburgense]|uniref:RDD family protein n=1 Tax=Corynebacterium freiburgense TaxID=556548 RepID=UPI0004190803|nr:RDD family protein [Corynebacterium freiburgense]WJZ03219.1 RDD family protein [Corynebacterium freiburgense]
MADAKHSWLDGPQIPAENDDPFAPGLWPGEKLGLPESGVGALASVMRRVGGIAFDWFLCMFAAIILRNFTSQLGGVSTITFFVFLILGTVSVSLFARTPGQAVFRMGVARVDAEERVGFIRAFVRTFLTLFVFPPILVDADGRGLHDRATGTAVILG